MDTGIPFLWADLMRWDIALLMASFLSSKYPILPSTSESRSAPMVSWVRSFEPMEKPSQRSANSSAMKTIAGTSAMRYSLKSLLRYRPTSFIMASILSSSSRVRTKGSITQMFLSPISSLAFLTARSSHMNASRYDSET